MNKSERGELAGIIKRQFKLAVSSNSSGRSGTPSSKNNSRPGIGATTNGGRTSPPSPNTRSLDANDAIAPTFEDEDLPPEWAPSLELSWYGRGENAHDARRRELRKVASTRLDAQLKAALVVLERQEVNLLRDLATDALDSQDARTFLVAVPSAAELVPGAALAEIEAGVELDQRDDRRWR